MPRALVTAFEPFGGETLNASLEALRLLPPHVGALEIARAELPTSFARALPALAAAIARCRPDVVLCVGQARSRSALSLERIAINIQDARIADNDGAQPVDLPVAAEGPAAYLSALPNKSAVAALIAAGVEAEISNTAGTFVCNHVFYGLMHMRATRNGKFLAGALHVPRTPEQTHGEENSPSMPLRDVVRGIVLILETCARELW